MNLGTLLDRRAAIGFAVLLAAAAHAQAPRELPPVEPPSQDFATAEEHYTFLYEQAGGGTEHTMETIPSGTGSGRAAATRWPRSFSKAAHAARAGRSGTAC